MKQGASYWLAVLVLALLPSCGGGSAQPPPAPALMQVILFDATLGAGAGVVLPITDRGIGVDTGSGAPDCPPAAHVGVGGIITIDPKDLGVGTFLARLGAAFSKVARTPPVSDPAVLEGVEDDCDLLDRFDEVRAYVDSVYAEAQGVEGAAANCAGTAAELYCTLIRKVDAAETIGFRIRAPVEVFNRDFGPARLGRVPRITTSPCARFYLLLLTLKALVTELRLEAARCEDLLSSLQHVIDATGEAHTEAEKTVRRVAAEAYLADAQRTLERVRALVETIRTEREKLVPSELADSCERCTPERRIDLPLPTGAVEWGFQWEPLQIVLDAVERGAAASEDPDERDRLEDIALRLLKAPADRVLHVRYRGDDGVGAMAVALADPLADDDQVSPVVVVLTKLARASGALQPNAADLERLHDGWRAFLARLPSGP